MDIDVNLNDIVMGDIIAQFDEKFKKEIDNRLVSYFEHPSGMFIYVGNYWSEKPLNVRKDIPDARLAKVPL